MGTLMGARAVLTSAVALATLLSAHAAWAADTAAAAPVASTASANTAFVSQIAARLGQAKGIRARFTQTRTLAAMKQPLVSSGSLLFFRERGAIWQIEKPYVATWVIGDGGVSEIDAHGQRVAGSGAQGARGAAEVSKMMRAMLAGDLSALYSQFDVRAEGTPAHWQLQLTPNQPQLAQSIKGLTMSGGDFLQTLRISLASGDVTQLDFTDSMPVTQLTPAERTLFGTP